MATTNGVLSMVARKYAHKIPMIFEDQPQRAAHRAEQLEQIMFAQIDQAYEMGCVGVVPRSTLAAPTATARLLRS